MTTLTFLTPWMCMVSTIPALQCRHFTVERSISNLYNNSQGFPARFLDFTLGWRKLGEVLHSKGLKNTWPFFLLISIGKQIHALSYKAFHEIPKTCNVKIQKRDESKIVGNSILPESSTSVLLSCVLMDTGKFQGKPYSNILLGSNRVSRYLENILLGVIIHWYKLNSRKETHPIIECTTMKWPPKTVPFSRLRYFKG